MSKKIFAICYDFDNTLSVRDMQDFSLIKKLGMETNEYYNACNSFGESQGMDKVSSYLKVSLDLAKSKNIKLTRKFLNDCGKTIEFFDGVQTWFDRINKYAERKNIVLEHYLISSGSKEIVEGSKIFKNFKEVYASEYLYDETGEACWPKNVINYTQKTQYIFRICKGNSQTDYDESVNEKVDKKRIEFENMIYIGDGFTDIPCMTVVKNSGGHSIAVYKENKKYISDQLLKDERVNFACVADYSENSQLDKIVKQIIDKVARN